MEIDKNNLYLEDSDKINDLIYIYFKTLPPCLDEEKQKQLFNSLYNGDKNVANILIESNLRLVIKFAKKYIYKGIDFGELIQEGNLGLIKAVYKYNPNKGYKFSTYARWWIRKYIQKYLQEKLRIVKFSIYGQEFNLRIQKIIQEENITDPKTISKILNVEEEKINEFLYYSQQTEIPIDSPINQNSKKTLSDSIAQEGILISEKFENDGFLNLVFNNLNPEEQLVIKTHFIQNFTTRETAEILGINRGKVDRLIKSIKTNLRNYVSRNNLDKSDLLPNYYQ